MSSVPRPEEVDQLVKIAKVRAVKEWQALDAQREKATRAGNQQAAQSAQQQMDQIARGYGDLGQAPRHVKPISAGGQEAGVDLMMGRREAPITQSMEGANQGGYLVRKVAKPDSPIAQGEDMTHLLSEKQQYSEFARMSPDTRSMVPAMYGHDSHVSPNGQVQNVSYHEYVPHGQAVTTQNAQQVAGQLAPLRENYGFRDIPLVQGGKARGNFDNVAVTPQGPKVLDFLPHGGSLEVSTAHGRDIPDARYTTPTGQVHTQTKYQAPANATPQQHAQVVQQLHKDVFAGRPKPMVRPAVKLASALPWIASEHAEHATDLGGLGLMAAGSADNLRSQLLHGDDNKGSLMRGPAGRSAADLAGYVAMAAPSLAALRHTGNEHAAGGGLRWVNLANLAGLGALGVSAVDKLQANIRAKNPEEAHHKMLLPHSVHQALDLGGLGTLAGTAFLKARGGTTREKIDAATLGAGYGTLAAPLAEDVYTEHVNPQHKQVFTGAVRPASELAGLGLLAAPSLLQKHSAGKLAEAQAGTSATVEYNQAKPRGTGAGVLRKAWETPSREDMYPDRNSALDRRDVTSTIPASGQSYLYDQQAIG